MRIAVLISGGVDSAVAVHRICEMGYKPDLFYIKIGMEGEGLSCTAEEDIELSTATARRYGLHLEVVDLQKQYWELVVGYAMERARRGLTPNPDVMCNKLIKFGCFEQEVGHRYDKIATGHYATVRERDGKIWLGTARDPVKDQTDFLAQIDSLQVAKLMFPVGDLMKEEVRRIAETQRLPSDKWRYRQGHQPHFMKGRLHRAGHGYRLESPERIQGIAPGQFGVVYDAAAEICIGSGEIGV